MANMSESKKLPDHILLKPVRKSLPDHIPLSLVGPQGSKGESITGDKGDQGARGESIKGDRGGIGETGDKGDQGDSIKGDQGDRGFKGDSIVGDIGPRGRKGEIGKTPKALPAPHIPSVQTPGPRGDKGDTGDAPEHQIKDNKFRFKKPNGKWGKWIDLPTITHHHNGMGGGGPHTKPQGIWTKCITNIVAVGTDQQILRGNKLCVLGNGKLILEGNAQAVIM